MKLFARTNMSSKIPNHNKTDVKSIFDNNGVLYDTLSIDCADNIEDVIDSVDSIDECEDAIALYQKSGCTSRASGLMNMVEELTNAKGYSANRYDLYNRVQQIRNKYSYLDTYSTCGYVY